MTKILNVKLDTSDGITTKTGNLSDGTPVTFCNPHHKWEWDCECGHVNGTRELSCDDCGKLRPAQQAKKMLELVVVDHFKSCTRCREAMSFAAMCRVGKEIAL